jgi:hypothetical protein
LHQFGVAGLRQRIALFKDTLDRKNGLHPPELRKMQAKVFSRI